MNRVTGQQLPWQRCPFLGLHDDSSTSLAYASPWNYCYRSTPPDSILVSYQARVCLCPHYDECAVYHSKTWGRLPRKLRGHGKAGKLTDPRSSRAVRVAEMVLLFLILLLLVFYGQHILS